MLDEKQKSCLKHSLVTHACLFDWKAFCKLKTCFYSSFMNDGEFIN